MKRHFVKKYIFSVLFLLLVFGFSAVNFYHMFPELKTYVQAAYGKEGSASEFVAGLEKVINENVYQKYKFVELYGFSENVLSDNIDNGFDYVRTKDGEPHYSDLKDNDFDIEKIEKNIEKIEALGKKNGAETLVFLAPQKYIKGESEFSRGVPYSDQTEELDEIRALMEEKNISLIDSRDYLKEIKSQTEKSVFYRTDHHWRPEAGFFMYGVLLETLQESWKEELNPEGFYTDLENYNIYEYENCFLGSMGREAGAVYSGVDDFTLMYPKFDTQFTRFYQNTVGGKMDKKEGTFYESLLAIQNLTYDGPAYQGDRYGTYLNGINVEDRITNHLNPEGPRILMIRDSYASVLGVFLANNCGQLDMLWSINYDGNFKELVETGNYDYVIVQISNVNMNNEKFLEFGL